MFVTQLADSLVSILALDSFQPAVAIVVDMGMEEYREIWSMTVIGKATLATGLFGDTMTGSTDKLDDQARNTNIVGVFSLSMRSGVQA